MANNRFTVQILGNVDYPSYAELQARVLEVLQEIDGFKVTTCNLTVWQDGAGSIRQFDDNGDEIVAPAPVIDKSDPPGVTGLIEDK